MSKRALNLLVAEDHTFQRSMLVKMLEGLETRSIHQAADGEAALDVIRDPARPIDIVICDLDMPGMDGMEFLRHIGESATPVSIILASALDRNLIASVATMTREYGIRVLGIVEKPLTPEKLQPLICLHEQRSATPVRPHAVAPSFSLEEIVQGLDNDEFEPYFQPKVELATGRVKGAESLARWRHPQRGIIPPSAFIQQLEQRLRMKGFGLSIDDYGTGYSSMQQLMRIAFTELKIDQSFVTSAARHESARVILESSLQMARKLGITAVAEGVETEEDWELLRSMHCDLAQGYYVARPTTAGAFLTWLDERRIAAGIRGTNARAGASSSQQNSARG